MYWLVLKRPSVAGFEAPRDRYMARSNECATPVHITTYDNSTIWRKFQSDGSKIRVRGHEKWVYSYARAIDSTRVNGLRDFWLKHRFFVRRLSARRGA